MYAGESGQNATPPSVTAAFVLQVVVAGLLVVLALVYAGDRLATGDRWATTGEQPPDPLDSAALLLALALWLGAAAFGLRRGHRGAYAMSLAGLTLPMLTLVAGAAGPGKTTYFQTGSLTAPDDDVLKSVLRSAAWDMVASAVTLAGGAMAFLLAAVTVVLLLAGPSRRFFTGTAPAPTP